MFDVLSLGTSVLLLHCAMPVVRTLTLRVFVGSVCSALSKQLLGTGLWPELASFMVDAARSPDAGLRELGVLLLTSVCEALGDKLVPLYPQVNMLLGAALKDAESKDVRLQGIKALGTIVCLQSHNESALQFRDLVPAVMDTLEGVRHAVL